MIFDLNNFIDGDEYSYQLEGELKSEDQLKGSDIRIIDPIKFKGEIFKVDSTCHLHIDINYTYESKCDRCLKPTMNEISTVLSGELKENKGKYNDEDELDEMIIYYENNLLNLKEYIWSQVVSSLPMKILCSYDCKGLCFKCGIDMNTQSCDCSKNAIDPRLEKLKELFPKK